MFIDKMFPFIVDQIRALEVNKIQCTSNQNTFPISVTRSLNYVFIYTQNKEINTYKQL